MAGGGQLATPVRRSGHRRPARLLSSSAPHLRGESRHRGHSHLTELTPQPRCRQCTTSGAQLSSPLSLPVAAVSRQPPIARSLAGPRLLDPAGKRQVGQGAASQRCSSSCRCVPLTGKGAAPGSVSTADALRCSAIGCSQVQQSPPAANAPPKCSRCTASNTSHPGGILPQTIVHALHDVAPSAERTKTTAHPRSDCAHVTLGLGCRGRSKGLRGLLCRGSPPPVLA